MLTYSFEDRGTNSLYGHLYRCIRRDIESGAIRADERLPSKRSFARQLGVSLITIEGAYMQLIAEGYVRSVERRGYYANRLSAPPEAPPSVRAAGASRHRVQLSEPSRRPAHPARRSERPVAPDPSTGSVATAPFPFAVWAKTLRETISRESERTLLRASPAAGTQRLTEALAGHLHAFRGLDVDPAQIVVGAGAQTLYPLIAQLVGRERCFAAEDPGYPRLARIYGSNGISLVPVPIDAQGIGMEPLERSGAEIAHLMPSHQFPTGIVTSAGRRRELLGWAARGPGRYLIEDDYDCEFRLAGRPIPALRGIDAQDRVIYANTFSRSLGPAFRFGYLVLPAALRRRFERELGFCSCTVSTMEQLALARFIEHGDFERHVNRMRRYYRTLRNRLLTALVASSIGDRLSFEGADSGLHFLLGIASGATEEALASAIGAGGVPATPLSAYRLAPGRQDAACVWRALFGAGAAGRGGDAGFHPFVVSYAGVPLEVADAVAEALTGAVVRTD